MLSIAGWSLGQNATVVRTMTMSFNIILSLVRNKFIINYVIDQSPRRKCFPIDIHSRTLSCIAGYM